MQALNPELRKLIDAIEAWPAAVSQYQRAQPKPAKPIKDEAAADGGEGENDENEELAPSRVLAPPALKLTSSLRAPGVRRMPSMASAVEQRDEAWRRSALGPALGPGTYQTTVEALTVHESTRRSRTFRSEVAQRPARIGLAGEPNLPEGPYAHAVFPHKPYGAIPGAAVAGFKSLGIRFGADGHHNDVLLQQALRASPPPRKPAEGLAPQWKDAPPVLVVPPDHAERLAAARATKREYVHY